MKLLVKAKNIKHIGDFNMDIFFYSKFNVCEVSSIVSSVHNYRDSRSLYSNIIIIILL